jgi:cell shape-determining protein MreC
MEEIGFFWKLTGIILGATGLWKIVELLIQYRLDRNMRSAKLENLHVNTENQLTENWIQWSQHLEQRVKELEAVSDENLLLTEKIELQRQSLILLEAKVESLEKENAVLKSALRKLKKDGK